MGLSSRESLDVVELVFYGSSMPLIVFILIKHGIGRQIGWIYLALLGILRIVGAATGIAAEHHPSQGLIETSLICYGVGISPLLLSLLGILKRVNEGMKGHGVNKRIERFLHLPIIAGLILSIIAGTQYKSFDQKQRLHPSKAGVLLYLVSLIGIIGVCVQTFARRQWILDGEMRLLFASIFALPFLLVRIIYAIITSFDHGSKTFSTISSSTTAVIVQSIMSVLMEFIVVAVFIAVGITVRKIPRSMVKNGYVDPPTYNATTGDNMRQEMRPAAAQRSSAV